MIGFYVNGEFLDLYPGNRVEFVKNHEIYASGDPEFIQTSYSLPVRVPLTPLNNRLLKYPGNRASQEPPRVIDEVVFYSGPGKSIGLPIFTGKLYVKEAGPRSAELFMVVDGLSIKKEITFQDLDFESHTETTEENMRTHMKATITDPDDYDYAFFPVGFGNKFIDESRLTESMYGKPLGIQMANYFDSATQHFVPTSSTKYAIVIPFFKVSYILNKIVKEIGYNLDNQFQTDLEMQRLYVLNNYSIYEVDAIPTSFNYRNHFPKKMKVVDFAKKICRAFFVGIFPNTITKEIKFIPLRDLLNQPHRHDWSALAEDDYSTVQDNSIPESFGYADDTNDALFGENVRVDPTLLGTFTDYWGATFPPTAGLYFFHMDRSYRQVILQGLNVWKVLAKFFGIYKTNGRGEPYWNECVPLFQSKAQSSIWPEMHVKGRAKFKGKDDNDNPVVMTEEAEWESIRLCFYRGIITGFSSPFTIQPYANCHEYIPGVSAGPPGNEMYDYSLHYDSPNGIIEKWGKEWLYFMQYKKIERRRFNLKLSDIINFQEYDKVWVSGQAYFIKSMRISFTDTGIDPVECEMYSIPQS